jgi:hypothetical protein
MDYEGLATEAIGLVFTPEVIENWGRMSIEQRAMYVEAAIIYLNQALGTNVNELRIYDMGTDTYGYRAGEGTIGINLRILADGNIGELGRLIDTILHEQAHQFQREVVANPERFNVPPETVAVWRDNFNNYISGYDDFAGYYMQPVEVHAREFAEEVMNRLGWNVPIDDMIYSRRN